MVKLILEQYETYGKWCIKMRWQTDEWKGTRPVYKSIAFITGIESEETANRIAAVLRAEFGELPS